MNGIQRIGAIAGFAMTLAGAGRAAASVVVADPARDRIAADEAAAIDALKAIAVAQERFKAEVRVDANRDGVGEYGYLAELALEPPFGIVRKSCAAYRGYLFEVWLPSAKSAGAIGAIREDTDGGRSADPSPDPVEGARRWCCYAWPLAYDLTGRSAFFVDQRGQVLECANARREPFSGRSQAARPGFDEAYSIPGNMGSTPRVGAPNANGTIWHPVR
jgi:hypothetical protein